MIKHISFDLWETLIKSNPLSKTLRAQLFWEYVKPTLCHHDVLSIIRKVEKTVDTINEGSGDHLSIRHMIAMILAELNISCDPLRVQNISQDLAQVFHFHGPQLIHPETIGILQTLRKHNITLNICSNTGFVPGSQLNPHVRALGITEHMSFMVYSDIIGVSKPSPLIFRHVHGLAAQIHKDLHHSEILHVGDNVMTDGACINVGMEFYDIAHGLGNLLNYVISCKEVQDTLNTQSHQHQSLLSIQQSTLNLSTDLTRSLSNSEQSLQGVS